MAKNVAELVTDILHAAGVKRIYGVVGDSLNGMTESLRRRGDMDWIHVRHEEVAAFAAGAEAALTGELAVCAGSCGPGNLHLINGLYDCQRTRVPVLAIAAQIPSAEIGRAATSRKPSRTTCSGIAATTVSWSHTRRNFPACWKPRSVRQSVIAALPSSLFLATSRWRL